MSCLNIQSYTASLPKGFRKTVLRDLQRLQAKVQQYDHGNKQAIPHRSKGICGNTATFDAVDYLDAAAPFWSERTKKRGAADYPVGGYHAFVRDSLYGLQWEGKQGAKRRRLLKWLIDQLQQAERTVY